MMDLGDIFDYQDVMTAASSEDILDLDDVFGPWIWMVGLINLWLHELSTHELTSNCMRQDEYSYEYW